MKKSSKSVSPEKVSVIIPAYNEEKYIEKCIESLKSQSYKKLQIIVVDDGSTDKTEEIANSYSEVEVLKGTHQGPGASRNLGAMNAKGEILIFVDADMTFDKNYVKNLVEPIEKDSALIGTTHGYEIASNLENLWASLWGKVRVNPDDGHEKVIFRAMRKKDFLKLGGFNSKYGYADDQTFWLEHHIKPLMIKEAICYHRNPETLNEVFKQSRWIGASIKNKITENIFFRIFLPVISVVLFPFAVIILSILKCYKLKNFKRFFPWMLIFITVRYIGTIKGIMRRIYLGMNIR